MPSDAVYFRLCRLGYEVQPVPPPRAKALRSLPNNVLNLNTPYGSGAIVIYCSRRPRSSPLNHGSSR